MRCIIITLFLAMTAVGFSATINVPTDYSSIQDAIDAAVNGDTVLVAPGTYVESIDFTGKAITVMSSDGPELTTISWNATGDVVTFENGETLESVLHGFTITKGFGIRCYNASPTISGNLIEGCLVCGVVCTHVANPDIVGNTISDCWQGINCDLDSSPLIMDNVIRFNKSVPGPDQGGTQGGGLYVDASGSMPLIVNNIIHGNSVYGGWTFAGAWIPGYGGGVYSTGTAIMSNNTIYGNSAEYTGALGGGVYVEKPTFIHNTIIWNNSAENGPQIWGYTNVTHCDIQGGYAAGSDNIDVNPLFQNPAGADFHLTFPSPCRDAGANNKTYKPLDMEGDPRIADGTADIGADEFYIHLYITGDRTPGGRIQGKIVGRPGTAPVGLFIGSGVLSSPMNTLWGPFHLQAPWFLFGPLGPMPTEGIMVLPTDLPTSPPAPYDIPMQALIGLTPESLTNLQLLEVR